MQNPPPVQTGKSSTGLDENVAAAHLELSPEEVETLSNLDEV